MQKALIVKDDGLIWATEVPEEPSKPGSWAHQEFFTEYYEDLAKYDDKLASAKENAVLVSDQKEAKRFVWYNQTGGYVNIHDFVLKPGIYPIPDLQWDIKFQIKRYAEWETTNEYHIIATGHIPAIERRKVAILKESTPSTEQESSESHIKFLQEQVRDLSKIINHQTKLLGEKDAEIMSLKKNHAKYNI